MKKNLLLACALLGLTASAPAAIIFSDTFGYPNGPIVGASNSPWVQHSAGAAATNINGQLRITRLAAEDINAPLSGAPYNTNNPANIYASFDILFTEVPTATGSYFVHLKDNGTQNFRCRLYSQTNGTDTTNSFRLAIANATNNNIGGFLAVWGTDLLTNVTYKVVMKYDAVLGSNTKLWINPVDETSSNVVAFDVSHTNVTDTTTIAFRQAAGIGTMLIDNLKVGTAFNDVAGADQAPSISSISTQNIPAGTSTPALPFIIGDDNTVASNLVLTAGSSNTNLVSTNNIVFGGADSNRTVTITPTAALEGESTISLSVTDGGANTTTTMFLLRVGAPSISDIANQITRVNTPTAAIPFLVSDAETNAASLTLSVVSANTNLIVTNDIAFGGTGSNRTITITPLADQTGFSVITVRVTDGNTTNSDSFVLTVAPYLGRITNTYFNIADGPLVDGSGNWVNTGGTLGELQVNNGVVLLTGAQGEDVGAPLAGGPFPPTNGAVLYASFKVLFTESPSNTGNYFAHFSDDGTTFRARVFAFTNTATPGYFRLGLANAATAVNAEYPADLALSNRYAVVVRYNTATAQSWLWLDPAGESDFNVAATDATTTSTITRYGLRQASGIGALQLDDLRVGGDYANVAPYIPLTPAVSGEAVTLTWPAAFSNYQAQATASLSPVNWTNLPDPVVTGSTNSIALTNASATASYRLIVK